MTFDLSLPSFLVTMFYIDQFPAVALAPDPVLVPALALAEPELSTGEIQIVFQGIQRQRGLSPPPNPAWWRDMSVLSRLSSPSPSSWQPGQGGAPLVTRSIRAPAGRHCNPHCVIQT